MALLCPHGVTLVTHGSVVEKRRDVGRIGASANCAYGLELVPKRVRVDLLPYLLLVVVRSLHVEPKGPVNSPLKLLVSRQSSVGSGGSGGSSGSGGRHGDGCWRWRKRWRGGEVRMGQNKLMIFWLRTLSFYTIFYFEYVSNCTPLKITHALSFFSLKCTLAGIRFPLDISRERKNKMTRRRKMMMFGVATVV